MKEHKPKLRNSAYGFYCRDCRKFVTRGYDNRDIDLGETAAVCEDCSEKYEFRKTNQSK